MNNADAVFDPLLTSAFYRQLIDKSHENKYTECESRSLFYNLNQPNNTAILPQAFAFIKQKLQQVKHSQPHSIVCGFDKDKLTLLKAAIIPPFDLSLSTRENHIRCIKQTTAVQLSQACCLQNIPQSFSSQSAIAIEIMSIYRHLTGIGRGEVDLTEAYCALLLDMGIQVPDLKSYSYSQQLDVIPELIDFSSIQLSLAMFPRVYFPEILGFTFACCQMPSLFEICFPDHQIIPNFFKCREDIIDKQRQPVEQCISTYLGLFPQQKDMLWQRVQQGFWLYYQQMQICRNRLQQLLKPAKPPSQVVAELIQNKAKAAIGHHHNILLEGRSLDSWFSGLAENSTEFLEALKQSKYVDQKKPGNSLLLKLFDFQGPMFGVADERELAIIKNWLKQGLNKQTETYSIKVEQAITIDSEDKFRSGINYSKLSNRELYFYLVNIDLYPDVLPTAKRKVSKLLQTCCLFNLLPFKSYSHQRFDRYIHELYQHEIQAYEPLQGKPTISKNAYLWGLQQMAPMILIDGCWLQKSLELQQSYASISEKLFSIYCDELGKGQLEQNHPYIFQQLLDSLSIQVPAVYKKEFVEHSGFINSAFDLPVYMLSLANHSVEFLPELLGLNMAIELSGLGRHYMRLVDDWNYWGIDPTIAKIHISIDNIASGHTFLAQRAIQDYMDEILQKTANQKVGDQHWRRIYTGYSSLRFVARRFKFLVPTGYLINKIMRTTRLANV